MSETTEASVVWPHEAREAAGMALHDAYCPDIECLMVPADLPGSAEQRDADGILAALMPHVEAMLDRARAEALREASDAWQTGGWASALPPKGSDRTQIILRMAQHGTQWLRERADRVGGAS